MKQVNCIHLYMGSNNEYLDNIYGNYFNKTHIQIYC